MLLSGNQLGATYGTSKEDYLVIDNSGICTYRVHSYDQAAVEKALDDALSTTNVPDDPINQPVDFNLEQNYPNPFNSQTAIKFHLNNRAFQPVLLKIYDLQGRLVRILLNENLSAGSYIVNWDGNDQNNRQVTSGVFYYQLQVGNNKEMMKMTLLR